MKRFLGPIAVGFLAVSAIIAPAAAKGLASHQQAKAFHVGVVLDVGGVNDKSFNHLAYTGLQQAESQLGVKGFYVVSGGISDYVPNLRNFASKHYNLVIAIGFLMANAIYQVASQFPRVHFAIVDSAPADAKGNTANLKNVANLFFKEQQSGYLVGVIAGLMEKGHIGKATHNKIGWMGGVSIPPVNRYIAGYVAGACKVDPSVKFASGYSQSFTDQSAGHRIGAQQISSGADILFQVAGASGLGYLRAAQQAGVYGIGVDADQGYLGKYVITSALKKVDQAVFLTTKATKSGHFKGGDHEYTLANGATGFAPVSSAVPASIVAVANKYEAKIASGAVVPPTNIKTGC